jgi:hypothetical protein
MMASHTTRVGALQKVAGFGAYYASPRADLLDTSSDAYCIAQRIYRVQYSKYQYVQTLLHASLDKQITQIWGARDPTHTAGSLWLPAMSG